MNRYLICLLFACIACQAPIDPVVEGFEPLPEQAFSPPDNPTTPEKVVLGKLLFYDPILSGEKDVSCASCHHPQFAFADGRELSLGVGAAGLGPNRQDQSGGRIPVVRRNAPSLINAAFNGLISGELYEADQAPMFWDNRVRSLEKQALEPIKAHEEMRGDAFSEAEALDSVVARLTANAEYKASFATAFPNEGPISADLLGKALAAYQRSLIAPNSRFDQYLRGNSTALDADEIEGMNQFVQRGCVACHGGPMLSDYQLHTLGVAEHPDLTQSDRGNGQDQFRTPTLRNVALTAPYMHNGTQSSLEEVMQFYNDQQSLHPEVADAELAQEFQDLVGMSNRRRAQIIAFMESLTDEPNDLSLPTAVPSGLPVGGR